jgi:AcrR family transcriptional regulator
VPRRTEDPRNDRRSADPAGRLPGGRHRLSSEEVAASQRTRILDAMRRTLAEEGYLGTGLTQVTGLAGVSRKTFYEHFVDKEDCFLAIYREARDRLYAPGLRARERPGDWPARTVAALAAFLEALAADPGGARICLVEVYAAGPRARELRNENLLELHGLFAPGPEDRDALGLGRPEPVAPGGSAPLVLGGLSEVLFTEIAAGRAAGLPHLLPDLAYLALAPYVGPTGALAAVKALTGRAL